MRRTDDAVVTPSADPEPAPREEPEPAFSRESSSDSDLEDFLESVEEENAARGARRIRRDVSLGLLALPVLFAGLVGMIVWVVPVITDWLPVALDYVTLIQVG